MSLLDEIIDGASSDATSTSNLLRMVKIASHRLGAEDIRRWADRELFGYESDATLPEYRRGLWTPAHGQWVSLSFQAKQPLASGKLPDEAKEWLWQTDLRQSLAELEQLSGGEEDPVISWPGEAIVMYMEAAKAGLVAHYAGANLVNAHQVLTRGILRGVIDAVRNTALEFALALQSADPDAGAVGGPTVAIEPVQQAIWHVEHHIYGDGAQIAVGSGITQSSQVVKGDLASLLNAAAALGLSEDGREELARAVLTDELRRSGRIKKFLAKVGQGAFAIGSGITAEVASAQLLGLISTYLG